VLPLRACRPQLAPEVPTAPVLPVKTGFDQPDPVDRQLRPNLGDRMVTSSWAQITRWAQNLCRPVGPTGSYGSQGSALWRLSCGTSGTLWASYSGRASGTGVALRPRGTLFSGGTLGTLRPISREVDFQNGLVTCGGVFF